MNPLTRIRRDESWRALALCQEVDPVLFFPEKGEKSVEALRICGRCDAREACLSYAMSIDGSIIGVWGGTTETQRKAMRRLYNDNDAAAA